MNPRSGGGKVGRFRLVERARAAGAQVRLTGPDQDAASLAGDRPGYLDGQQRVDAVADTRRRPLESPQVVLLSNSPYHITTLRHLGRRFALDTGHLGGIAIKRPAGAPPPDLLPRLRRD